MPTASVSITRATTARWSTRSPLPARSTADRRGVGSLPCRWRRWMADDMTLEQAMAESRRRYLNAATAQNMGIATNQNGWQPRPEEWYIQQSILQQQAFEAANQRNTTLLSGMPVPSPVSHAKQQADARIAELEAKLATLTAALAEVQIGGGTAEGPM